MPGALGGGAVWREADPEAFARSASVFVTRAWHEIKGEAGRHLELELSGGGERLAVVAVREIRVPGLYRRWAIPAEPALIESGVGQAEALALLLDLARARRVDVVDSRFNMARWGDPGVRDLVEAGDVEPFGTYVVDLGGDRESRRAAMHKKHRYQLGRAEREGVEIGGPPGIDDLADLMEGAYGKGGRRSPFSRAYLSRVLERRDLDLIAPTARRGGRIEAVAVVPYDARRGYYLHGASRVDAAAGASILLQAAVMDELASRGVLLYDLGGARPETDDPRLEGIFRFKRRFGGAFEPSIRWRLPLTAAGRLVHGTSGA